MKITVTQTKGVDAPDLRPTVAEAINQTAAEAREHGIDVVSELYNVSHFATRSKASIVLASAANLAARIEFKGKRMPLIDFNPVQTATGVAAEVRRGTSAAVKSAFIAVGRQSGKRNVFIRIEALRKQGKLKASNRAVPSGQRKHGYPITTVKSISIPDMLRTAQVRNKLLDFIAFHLPENVANLINKRLDRGN